MGILNEIDKHKSSSKYKKIVIIFIFSIFISYFSYSYFLDNGEKTVKQEKQIETFVVKNGDLKTSISGDGKILYRDDYNINFPISGTVKEIYKNIGDDVKSGEKIAILDTTYFNIDLQKAEIALEKTQADLNAKINSYSQNDISLANEQLESTKTNFESIKLNGQIDIQNAQNNLEQSKINLETISNDLEIAKNNLEIVKNQEQQIYDNKLENVINQINLNISYNKEVFLEIDILLGISNENKDKNNDFENYLGAKNTSIKYQAINSFYISNNLFNEFLKDWEKNIENFNGDKSLYLNYLESAINISKNLNNTLGFTLEVLKNSISSVNSLNQSDIDNYINNYENQIIKNKEELNKLLNVKQIALEQKNSMESKIINQENIIKTSKLKLDLAKQNLEEAQSNLENSNKKYENNLLLAQKQIDISKIGLEEKNSIPSDSELGPYYSNIENAKKNLDEARIKFNDAILYSPINGKIVDINGNIGSFVGGDKDTYFVSITNNTDFFVESYIEELDITRIKQNSKVYLSFDAIDGLILKGKVSFISEKSTTDSNGIVTYRIEIQFNPEDSNIKEGMTTYIDFITQEVKNIKIIPVGAVKTINGKPSVKQENGQFINVVTGFTDGKMVEIISGLEIGDKILY